MHTQKIYDVIIINYNSTECTIKCIESIYKIKQDRNVNIIVVDNASKDEPKRIFRKFQGIRFIENNKNVGFAKGVNSALRCAESEYILLINPDALLIEGFFEDIYNHMADNADVAISGPKIYESNGTIQGSARKFPSALTSIFGRKSPLTKLFPNNAITRKEFISFNMSVRDAVDVDWVSGACMLVRRKAFEAVSGFDEGFFLYWEDADLCKRLKDSGWRIIYYPKAKVKHFVGISSNTRPIASIYHFHHSCYKYFSRHAHGLQRFFKPISILGLALRCLFVIFLNMLKRKIKSANYNEKKFN